MTLENMQPASGEPQREHGLKGLPWWLRFYVYAIQGFCDELVFTSLFDFVQTGDWQLKGHSSLHTFFIYGLLSLIMERVYLFLYYKHGVSWYVCIPLYLIVLYVWEFSTGLFLRQFGACPWDYSHYRYNFMGLITLEYAPGWLVLCAIHNPFADFLLRLRIDFSVFNKIAKIN